MVHVVGHRPAKPRGLAATTILIVTTFSIKCWCSGPSARGGGVFQWWEWAGYQVFALVLLVRIL
ncbi:hypothetical protein AXK64_23365, partial [Salmonella enterica subsp. enterica]|nr:hypothetical protein [Salmonella enterica subsp. enterica]